MRLSVLYFYNRFAVCLSLVLLITPTSHECHAQFELTWVDIGDYHGRYGESGGHYERQTENRGVEWPAILRGSGQIRNRSYWIGVKNWRDESGTTWDYRVARMGPRLPADGNFTPVESRLVARFEDTQVLVDGLPGKKNIVVVNEIDPALPADRMFYHRYRSIIGIETERWIYAYAHDVHDDFHIIRRRMVNNGNTDADPDIELPGQALQDVYLSNLHRYVGRSQAAWHGSIAQVWGKFSMIDIVGDGNEEYPVDFTAIYMWQGFDPVYSSELKRDNLGSPMLELMGYETPGDTIGRLAGISMPGRLVLHADESATDSSYNPLHQPSTLGWVSSDAIDNVSIRTQRDYYEKGIRTVENPDMLPGGSSRMYPHYADRVEPTGEFWNPTRDGSKGDAGGQTVVISYGPYQLAFGDTINIAEVEGSAGLSYEAATQVGVAYKESGFDDDVRIPFDANGDGLINEAPWNYEVYNNGSELLTKNQWVLTARDSLFQALYRARDVWEASERMTRYPITEPPRPPRRFEVTSQPDRIRLNWETMSDAADPESWEIYRTREYVDKLPYEQIATLPGSARSFDDTVVNRGVDYYYYIQAIGSPNAVDDRGITGTPGGRPLKSGRHFTQTHYPARLLRQTGNTVSDFRIVPNPINLASDESVRIIVDGDPTRGRVEFMDIPGHATISIYTEIGELVQQIEHTTGGGITAWDLTTASRLPVVSGIYLVRVFDHATGEADVKKLVVIK